MLLAALIPVALQLAATRVAPGEATVLVAGDVVPHADVLASVRAHGAPSLLWGVAGLFARADAVVVNLEAPAVLSQPETVDGSLRFNASAALLDGLAGAGVDVVSLANNHGYDQGPEGIATTVGHATARGLRVAGASAGAADPFAPVELTVLGRSLCVVAATRILNFPVPAPRPGQARLALARPEVPGEEAALLAAVRTAASRCGGVIVSLHTGSEYGDQPERRDRGFFRAVARAGAMAVLGHHSHTAQPVETVRAGDRTVPLFYSLGNLVSAQGSAAVRAPSGPDDPFQVVRDPRTREGVLAVLRFAAAPQGRLALASWGWVPLWTQNDRETARARGATVTISADVMPWQGGASALLRHRWNRLTQHLGLAHRFDGRTLPGAETAYASSSP